MLISALCVGMHKSVMKYYTQFVTGREVFGVELFTYEKVKNQMAQMCTDCFFNESAAYFLAGIADEHPHSDMLVESAITKVHDIRRDSNDGLMVLQAFCTHTVSHWTDRLLLMLGHNGLCETAPYLRMQQESQYLLGHQVGCCMFT